MNLLVDTNAGKMKLIMRKYLTHALKINMKVWIKWMVYYDNRSDKVDLKGQQKSNESKFLNFCGGKIKKTIYLSSISQTLLKPRSSNEELYNSP